MTCPKDLGAVYLSPSETLKNNLIGFLFFYNVSNIFPFCNAADKKGFLSYLALGSRCENGVMANIHQLSPAHQTNFGSEQATGPLARPSICQPVKSCRSGPATANDRSYYSNGKNSMVLARKMFP